MLNSALVRIPGKLLLLGEYAVTEGATALVATVDRQARVEITALSDGDSLLFAPDIHADPLPFRLTGNGVQWRTGRADNMNLFEAAMATFAATGNQSILSQSVRISLCTREFFDATGKNKLGLGSSAALTVALLRALHRFFIDPDQDLPLEQQFFQAIEAHHRFQSGLGSGVDIAASVAGGILAYRLTMDQHLHMQSLAWPSALKVALVWTGKPASTRIMLQQLGEWRHRHPRQYAQQLARLSEVSEAGASAFAGQRSDDFLISVETFASALGSLGEQAGIDIFSREHRQLAQLAGEQQLVYKPSGAGGGDFGLAFGVEQAAIEAFKQQCSMAGYPCPRVKINKG